MCDNICVQQPQLELNVGKLSNWDLHPFFDRLQRKKAVDGLAGIPILRPKFVPINVCMCVCVCLRMCVCDVCMCDVCVMMCVYVYMCVHITVGDE